MDNLDLEHSWIDQSSYWIHRFPQGSKEWLQERKFHLTATQFSGIVRPSFYCGEEDIIRNYTNPPIKSIQDQMACHHGLTNEPIARKWYQEINQVQVEEVGLIVPKWDPRLGYSSDGLVGQEGLIEIKCPARIYPSLLNSTSTLPKEYITPSHYDQIQGGMAITGRKWCDYVVYCRSEEKLLIDRVPFDSKYWKEVMYPKLQSFLDRYQNKIFPNRS